MKIIDPLLKKVFVLMFKYLAPLKDQNGNQQLPLSTNVLYSPHLLSRLQISSVLFTVPVMKNIENDYSFCNNFLGLRQKKAI